MYLRELVRGANTIWLLTNSLGRVLRLPLQTGRQYMSRSTSPFSFTLWYRLSIAPQWKVLHYGNDATYLTRQFVPLTLILERSYSTSSMFGRVINSSHYPTVGYSLLIYDDRQHQPHPCACGQQQSHNTSESGYALYPKFVELGPKRDV
jgi:hypothetical protein